MKKNAKILILVWILIITGFTAIQAQVPPESIELKGPTSGNNFMYEGDPITLTVTAIVHPENAVKRGIFSVSPDEGVTVLTGTDAYGNPTVTLTVTNVGYYLLNFVFVSGTDPSAEDFVTVTGSYAFNVQYSVFSDEYIYLDKGEVKTVESNAYTHGLYTYTDIDYDEDIISVTEGENGALIIEGKKAGKTLITVTPNDDEALRDYIWATVRSDEVETITLNPSGPLDLVKNRTEIIHADTYTSWDNRIYWYSEDPEIASVEATYDYMTVLWPIQYNDDFSGFYAIIKGQNFGETNIIATTDPSDPDAVKAVLHVNVTNGIVVEWDYDSRYRGNDVTATVYVMCDVELTEFDFQIAYNDKDLVYVGYEIEDTQHDWEIIPPSSYQSHSAEGKTPTAVSGSWSGNSSMIQTKVVSFNYNIPKTAQSGPVNYSLSHSATDSGGQSVQLPQVTDDVEILGNSSNAGNGSSALERLTDADTLPQTGISRKGSREFTSMPKNLNYTPLYWTLEIPTISLQSEIVEVPYMDGEYPVTWLGEKVGLLEGSALPGEGMSVLTGHNNLNNDEIGPFAFLQWLQEGDRIYVHNARDDMQTYVVYANEKISETDMKGFEQIISQYDNSLILITCEDELYTGGFANRRIISAKPM